MPFRAGQCISVGLHKSGVNREYSLYSGEQEPYLDLLIRAVEGGSVSPLLQKAAPGTVLDIQGPYSEFVLKDPLNRAKKYLFVATGTGVSPFHSFVKSHPHLDYRLIHGVRNRSECYDAGDYEQQRYTACLSRERADGAFQGRVTDYLLANPAAPGTVCYLCGNRKMIEEVFDILRSQGIGSDDIFTEVFF
jgi:ferredoxin-NADP reductase